MDLKEFIKNNDLIFIIPRELKEYFFEIRKSDPFLNFKIFTLDEVISNLRGNFSDKNVLKISFKYYPNYTYSLIKQVSKYLFYSFANDNRDEVLADFCSDLVKNKYLKYDYDFVNLLKSRKIVFINFEDSTFIKTLIKKLELVDYSYIKLNDFIDMNNDYSFHEFFSIGDEIKYALNEILGKIDYGISPEDFLIVCDVDRYKYYLKLFLSNIDVPIYIEESFSYVDTRIFKDVYSLINDEFNVIDYLSNNKEKYDQDEFNKVYDILTFYEIDNLKNKKTNFKEILSSYYLRGGKYINSIKITSKLNFSDKKYIYILGLDNTFLPKVIKDNKLYSFDYLHSRGFDSLDDTNLIKTKLEEAFIKQKHVNFISYHIKDNNGRYSPSYYVSSLSLKKSDNDIQEVEYINDVSKIFYRNFLDQYEKNGIVDKELPYFKNTYNNELPETYSSDFKRITNYIFDYKKRYSYSSLSSFHLCPFNYFCEQILKVGLTESNIYQKYGTITHSVLEHVYDENFKFDKEVDIAIGKYNENNSNLSEKENLLLKRFIFELKQTVEKFILVHKNNMTLLKNYSEIGIQINKKIKCKSIEDDNNRILENEYDIALYGKIDSVIQTSANDIYIIDYKTGNDTFSKNDVKKYGLSLQLPTYMYLIHNTDKEFFKGKDIKGVFLEKIVAAGGRFYNFKSPTKEDLDCLLYDGVFVNDYDSIIKFDHTLNEKKAKSKFVIGLQVNSKGDGFSAAGKGLYRLLKDEDINEFDNIVQNNFFDSVQKIAYGNFNITPFYKGNVNMGCRFCKNFDICFKKDRNEDLQ